ncbi:hypothetical protein N7488_008596 [Penicillium malachiteum]|nr:hypothetical protein N7488_008596 [Penicillium malachiteum]
MTRVACFASSDGNVRFPKFDPMRDFDDLDLRSTSGLSDLTNPYWVDQVTKMSKSNRSELIWLTLNHTNLGNYSLGIIATVPSNHENSTITVGCEIDPHWVDAKYSIKQSQIAGVYGATWITEPQIYPDAWVYHPVPPQIRISHDWAEYLNPLISSSNQTAFEHMVLLAVQIDPEKILAS